MFVIAINTHISNRQTCFRFYYKITKTSITCWILMITRIKTNNITCNTIIRYGLIKRYCHCLTIACVIFQMTTIYLNPIVTSPCLWRLMNIRT